MESNLRVKFVILCLLASVITACSKKDHPENMEVDENCSSEFIMDYSEIIFEVEDTERILKDYYHVEAERASQLTKIKNNCEKFRSNYQGLSCKAEVDQQVQWIDTADVDTTCNAVESYFKKKNPKRKAKLMDPFDIRNSRNREAMKERSTFQKKHAPKKKVQPKKNYTLLDLSPAEKPVIEEKTRPAEEPAPVVRPIPLKNVTPIVKRPFSPRSIRPIVSSNKYLQGIKIKNTLQEYELIVVNESKLSELLNDARKYVVNGEIYDSRIRNQFTDTSATMCSWKNLRSKVFVNTELKNKKLTLNRSSEINVSDNAKILTVILKEFEVGFECVNSNLDQDYTWFDVQNVFEGIFKIKKI